MVVQQKAEEAPFNTTGAIRTYWNKRRTSNCKTMASSQAWITSRTQGLWEAVAQEELIPPARISLWAR